MQHKPLDYLKSYLQGCGPYILARQVKRSLQKGFREAARIDRRVAALRPAGSSLGNVLFSYISSPFFLKPGQPVPISHTHYWESLQMVRTFLELGYCVDVINWRNTDYIPRKRYSVFVDVRLNLERIAPMLDQDCVRIMHIETAHWLFNTTAQSRRLLALQQRKGVTLTPYKIVQPNWAIEHADCATILGNEFTIDTYRYANKPIYRVPISAPVTYDWADQKDFGACRRRFLWFGGSDLVHKGLDLVLEAFAQMPEYHLTVCGPVQQEEGFERIYCQELYHTPNIQTIGWVDVNSPAFVEIAHNCIGLVYPSCAEGGGGGVITCLHAGLIPIVSNESSVDIDSAFGMTLRDCTIGEIQRSVQTLSDMPVPKLRDMAHQAWEFARSHHTREIFTREYRNAITSIMEVHSHQTRTCTPGWQSDPRGQTT